jgi:hypothetical protein
MLTPRIPLHGHALPPFAVRLLRHRVNARRVNPTIVKVEERADSDCAIDRLVRPSGATQGFEIGRTNSGRIVIDLGDESEQRLVSLVEPRRFEVRENSANERFIAQQFRRNCGVRLDSKGTIVAVRGIRRDQLPHTRAER